MGVVVKRFDVFLVNLDPTVGSEIKKTRPCVVVSPDEMNRYRAHLKSFDDYGMMIEDVKSKENELLKQSDRYRMGNPRTAVARGATSEEKNSTAGLELSSAD